MEKEKKESKIVSWMPLIELVLILFTTLGSTIPLCLHMDNKFQASMAKQAERSDRLYEMFIDMLKEKKAEK